MIRGVLGSRASIGGVLGSGRGGGGNGLLTGLVGYWALDEAGGANDALDKHSRGLTLTQYNSPSADTGKVYVRARTVFAGSTQYFSRASETALQTGNIQFALSAWVYFIASATPVWVLAKDNGTNREYNLVRDGTKWVFSVGTGAGGIAGFVYSTETVVTDDWTLLTAWSDPTAGKVYIATNNNAPAEAALTGTPGTGTATFDIGRRSSGSGYINMRCGPVCLWKNRTLSAADRTALWNGGAGLAYSAFS